MLLLLHRKMENQLISNADCKFTGDSWPSAEDIKTALKHTKAPVSDNLSTYIIMCSPTPLKRGKWASARSLRQKKRADLTIIHLFRVICFVTNTNATETKRIFNQYN